MRRLARSPNWLHAPGIFFLILLAFSGLRAAPQPAAAVQPFSSETTSMPAADGEHRRPPAPVGPFRYYAPVTFSPSAFTPPASAETRPPAPAPTARPRQGLGWQGIDFSPGAPEIAVTLYSGGTQVNDGRDTYVTIRPGWPCEYWDFRACVRAQDDGQNGLILVTVHSGVGGDGQALRHALEGTGFNQAGIALDAIHARLAQLGDAQAELRQGEQARSLRVMAAARIPPPLLDGYFARSPLDVVRELAASSPGVSAALQNGAPLLVIETCGWRHAEEWGLPGSTDTTGSVYLLILSE